MRKRRAGQVVQQETFDARFCEWVASLPFVVERPHGLSDEVRMFAVDCPALERGATWLVFEQRSHPSALPNVTVILPRAVARRAERSGSGIGLGPMRADQVLFKVSPLAGTRRIEALVVAGYTSVMAGTSARRDA